MCHTLHPLLSMTPDDGRLGTCPHCGHDIRKGDELITYQRSDDSIGVFAECPSCETVVDPRRS
jgi:hypothetical protein